MGGLSSQVFWKQPWTPDGEASLRLALAKLNCSLRELRSQKWSPSAGTIGGVRDYKTCYLAPGATGWSSVLLHLDSRLGDPLARELSSLIAGVAIAFHERDQAAWGYQLFRHGEPLDLFWNDPKAANESAERCAARPDVLSEVFGTPKESLVPYLRHLKDGDHALKAFKDDEFALGDHWVRIDFMKRLGLGYPEPGRAREGRFVVVEEPSR